MPREDHIRVYTIDEDGRLTERHADMLTVAAGAGPRHMAFHPAKHVAYCLNELNATINVYREWVKVREIQSVDMMADDYSGRRWAADIHITPDGRHLYACERASSVINHYGCRMTAVICSWRGVIRQKLSRAVLRWITAGVS